MCAFMKSMNTYKANISARPLYGDAETGSDLQRGDYTLNPETRRSTFVKGNRGSRPKVLQIKAREFIIKCCNGESGVQLLVKKLYAQALRGNFRAQELLLNYILGKPTEKVKIESANENGIAYTPIVRIIADHLRLEKLNKDIDGAPTVVEQERVEEMERVLNGAINGTPTRTLEGVTEEPSPIEKQSTIYKESKKSTKIDGRKGSKNRSNGKAKAHKRSSTKRRKK